MYLLYVCMYIYINKYKRKQLITKNLEFTTILTTEL